MSDEIVERSLELLDSGSDQSAPDWHVNLFGGEPTLRPDLIHYICAQATARSAARARRSASH
jgi:uncharacterized protein